MSNGVKKILLFLLLFIFPIYLVQAEELSERLKGRILLQVESYGEAWYINPDTQKRFYLGRPADAFQVMREQGLGISNKDFSSFKGYAPLRLSGKILLKVEANGEAYYVNPVDLKMHYLGRPDDAFNIMRTLGLGITNKDLDLINIDDDSAPLITGETEEVIEITPEPEETATSTEEIIIPEEPEETATTTEEVVAEETATTTCVWLAEYFDNKSLFGSPIATNTVDKIDFDWERGGPDGIGKIDNFSARFTVNCYFEAGRYEFRTSFDDAIRVYLDDFNFLESWTDNDYARIINRERNVEAGEHKVRVHYYEASGKALVSVDWVKLN